MKAREEYFARQSLEALGLTASFLRDAMIPKSQFRKYKPEWEGANTRIAAGVDLHQLAFVLRVVVLQSLNSRSGRNFLYVPVFYLKFLRGFVNPLVWKALRQVA